MKIIMIYEKVKLKISSSIFISLLQCFPLFEREGVFILHYLASNLKDHLADQVLELNLP